MKRLMTVFSGGEDGERHDCFIDLLLSLISWHDDACRHRGGGSWLKYNKYIYITYLFILDMYLILLPQG